MSRDRRFPVLVGMAAALAFSLGATMAQEAAPDGGDQKRGFKIPKLLPNILRKEEPAEPAEAAEEEPPAKRSGLIGRIRQLREKGDDAPAPEPTAVATPVAAKLPPQQGRVSDPTLSDRRGAKSKKKVLTIPVTPEKPAIEKPRPATQPPMPKVAPPPVVAEEAPPPPPVVPVPAPVPVPTMKDPPAGDVTDGTHFVTIRDGVEAKVTTPEGRPGVLKAGTVLRFDSKDDTRVRARLANGTGIEVELWQVRDATFEEAVKFIQSGD